LEVSPVSDILPDDPARRRYERLIRALGNPALSAYEASALARLCAWSSEDDIRVLVRLIDRRSRDVFQVGRLNAQAEAEGGTE
jgi:hypothetical protein